MTKSDFIQIAGCITILMGYWRMAKDVKWASASLAFGCLLWAIWSLSISPPAYWMGGLEVVLGAMSVRTFWLNRRG